MLLVSVTGNGVAVPFVAGLLIVTHFDVVVGVTFDVEAGFCGVEGLVAMTWDAGVTAFVINCDVMYCCCDCVGVVSGFVMRLEDGWVGVTAFVTDCDVGCVGVTAFVTCDVCVTGLIAICDGFCIDGVTAFDLLGNAGGSLAGLGNVGITPDVIGGITVVTGVDGADTADIVLPENNFWYLLTSQ